jgi:hypothetical protein
MTYTEICLQAVASLALVLTVNACGRSGGNHSSTSVMDGKGILVEVMWRGQGQKLTHSCWGTVMAMSGAYGAPQRSRSGSDSARELQIGEQQV